MARGNNLDRVKTLQGALKRAQAGDTLTLSELAILWGTTKGAFVNTRARMLNFPQQQQGKGNEVFYDAPAALRAMLDYETKSDEEERQRQARAAAILGMDRKPGRAKKTEIFLPPSEMMKLHRLRAEIEERERNMGLWTKTEDVRSMFQQVFQIQSEYLGHLENKADPNGLFPPDLREAVGKAGRECLLLIHRKLSDMLPRDADNRPRRTQKPRGPANGAGREPAVRTRKRRAPG